jgi:hypothetical protein
MGRTAILALVTTLAAAPGLSARQSAATSPAATPGAATTAWATRAQASMTLDGLDSEAAWGRATAASGFRQYDPELDAEPSQGTEFKVAYDADNLYVFVRAFDTAPDSILRALSRRDVRGPSYQIGVLVDYYLDRLSGFACWVNRDGV